MLKKKKRKSNKKESNSSCNEKKSTENNKSFSSFSYAELVALSATLGYSIAQELDEDDLAIFLVFLELLVIEMQLIVTQRAIEKKTLISTDKEDEVEDIDLDDI